MPDGSDAPDPVAGGAVDLRMDAATVRRWASAALDALGAHRDEIDALNVYPVPDGDTGTNMLLTLRAMTEALRRERPRDLTAAAEVMARGALMGARGNSGVILSQFVRGMAEVLGRLRTGQPLVGAPSALAESFRRGAVLARSAVVEPAEGTILTVADAAASAAEAAATDAPERMDGIAEVATAAARAAADAVERTPQQLPVLARAGVVDAGGRGLSIILDALASVTGGTPAGGARWARRTPAADEDVAPTDDCSRSPYGYEVVYLLEATEPALDVLRGSLRQLGDSLVIVSAGAAGAAGAADAAGSAPGDTDTITYKVHVHVNDIGAAIEAGIAAGHPHAIEVTRFADQPAPATPQRSGVAIVAITPGDTLRSAFAGEGAVVVDSGGSRRPSTAEVLEAITATKALRVVVLPNDRDCAAVADAAAAEARTDGIDVAVLPTKSVIQGLAALAVHDPERRFADDVIAMAETAAATRFASVSVAAREALTTAGRCQPGDVLGMVDDDVVVIGVSILDVGMELLDRLLAAGGELVTVVVGNHAPSGVGDALQSDITTRHPEVEVVCLDGGHPDTPVLIGVE